MGLKRHYPDIAFSGNKVTPEEIDRYEIYTVINPSYGTNTVGTFAVAGTSASKPLVLINAIADYPRNLNFRLAGTHAAMGGTLTVNGYDQFGKVQTEALGNAGSDNGGTYLGTKVFAVISSGTLNYGTAVGNGTASLGWGTAGTSTLWGLPFKLGGTSDIKMISFSSNHLSGSVPNGGTIAAYVDVPRHCIKSPYQVAGTAWTMQVWAKPTYDASSEVAMANLSQRE